MGAVHFLAWFFGAALQVNAVPHAVSGLCGRGFPTPFATPPGRGLSSPVVNALWASVNLVAGYLLIWQVGRFDPHRLADAMPALAGAVVAAVLTAWMFGRNLGWTETDRQP